jgi:hypothetical protein
MKNSFEGSSVNFLQLSKESVNIKVGQSKLPKLKYKEEKGGGKCNRISKSCGTITDSL